PARFTLALHDALPICMTTFAGVPASASRCSVARSAFGHMLYVTGSMSENTGTAPACKMALAVAMKVNGVVTTRSPGWTPAPRSRSEEHTSELQSREKL